MRKNKLIFLGLVCLSFHVAAEKIFTPDAPAPIGTYSQAIKSHQTIYISGQIGIDPKTGELVDSDFNHQLQQVFKNMAAIAKAAGGNINDVAKLTIYVTDLSHFNSVNDIMKGYFHEPYPARAVIEVKALPKNALVEIEAIMSVS